MFIVSFFTAHLPSCKNLLRKTADNAFCSVFNVLYSKEVHALHNTHNVCDKQIFNVAESVSFVKYMFI